MTELKTFRMTAKELVDEMMSGAFVSVVCGVGESGGCNKHCSRCSIVSEDSDLILEELGDRRRASRSNVER